MSLAITMTAYRRPTYTRRVLESLEACDGISECCLWVNCDPGNKAVKRYVRGATDRAIVNDSRLGLNRNTYAVLSRCLYDLRDIRVDGILHIEDDTVLSPDALRYYMWALRTYGNDEDVFTISGYNKTKKPPEPKDHANVKSRQWFTCWGWAASLHRVAEMLRMWSFKNPKSFATHQNKVVRGRRWEVYPVVSRVQNIGYRCGENGRSEGWYRKNHRTPYVATTIEPGTWDVG